MNINSQSRTDLLTRFAFFVCLTLCMLQGKSTALVAQDVERHSLTGTTMGVVTWNVTLFADESVSAASLQSAIEKELQFVNQLMSTYIADSDVSRFNAQESDEWVPVDPATVEVIQRALEISEKSDGAFDITVLPLVDLWRFKSKPGTPEHAAELEEFGLPNEQEIESVMKGVGYRNIECQTSPPALRKKNPVTQIDLSAIAKGYAVDRVCDVLQAMQVDRFLVEVGGEIRTSGEKPDKTGWRVGIEKPLENARKPHRVFELYHKSLASSGDYRNFYNYQGQRYSHTIDPRTGRPVRHSTAATSVIAKDCMTADALATALMVLTPAEGLKLAEDLNVEALILTRVGTGIRDQQTRGFPTESSPSKQTDNSLFRMIAIASIVFAFAVVAMAVGVIFGREKLKGSCGGIAALDNPDVTPECSLCSRAAECSDLKQEMKRRTDAGSVVDE